MSERRACRVLGQSRSTQRYQSTRAQRDADLTKQMKTLAADNPRYGYRRVAALLRRDGWAVNLKRVYRLWKRAGLQVPQKQRKRRRIEGSEGTVRLAAAYPNHVWSYDFLFDTTENGRTVKLLAVVDEYTRECLALEAARSIKSGDVIKVVDRIAAVRGYSAHVRLDNGPEFIAKALQEHLQSIESETRYIDPGAPWQNAYVESFNGKLRDELLAREAFGALAETQVLVAAWRRHYNESRPHSSLDYQTPAAFAASYSTPAVA
ncbi:MAG: IS3 family transposase [Bacteroidota bacterium]